MAAEDADLQEIRGAFEDDDAVWAPIRKARQTDVKALTPASTWDEADRKDREKNGRPCLSFDELGQYVNQLVNDARETKRAIEVNPSSDETSEPIARFVGDLIRQIEYRSNAQMAYTQMFDDAASGSYGFLRIVPRYLQQGRIQKPTARSFDQELILQSVHNPDLITPSYFTKPDFSDCKRFWVHESYSHADFNAEFPDAKISNFTGAMSSVGVRWCDDKRVWVRELWELKTKPRKLALLENPQGPDLEPLAVWVDTIPDDQRKAMLAAATRVRTVDEPYVCQKITNGLEVLREKEDWPGRFIPIIGCVGKVVWTNEERQILSLIRNALGPQQLYNYYRTSEAEIVGMTPKVPWFYYEGVFDQTAAQDLADSNRVPIGALAQKAFPEGWNPAHGPAPFPVRNAYEPPIQAFEMGAESTRRGIQSATGTGFLPTQAQQHNQKSGVALKEIATSAQKGAYHFVDNYQHAIRRVGEVLVDLIPHYYDTARAVHVRGNDDKTQQIRINDPAAPAPKTYGDQPILLKAEHEFDVTISTGPSYATEREKASEFADQLVTARPEIFAAIGGDVVRLKNLGPIGDKLAEVLDVLAPPAVQQMKAGNEPMPPQAQQAMAQLQQAQQMIAQLQEVIKTDQIKGQTQIKIKELDGQIRMAIAELQGRQKLQLLGAQAAADIDTREDEQVHEMAMKGADAAHGAQQAREAAEHARESEIRAATTSHLRPSNVRSTE